MFPACTNDSMLDFQMQEKEKLQQQSVQLPDIHKDTRQIDKAVGGWRTSSSAINATVGRHDTKGTKQSKN